MKFLPCDEKNLAFLTVLVGGEIEIVDGIAALICRERGGEIIVTFFGTPKLLHHHSLALNLEDYEPEVSLGFQFQELQLTVIMHSHSRCSIRLAKFSILVF